MFGSLLEKRTRQALDFRLDVLDGKIFVGHS